ncbi:hypothetical protein [Mesorhizobium sp.]|uniref:hypothetical protein n=1 Tax=Mesorhizobium sp. TaxID=1871066 RepID=UPI00121BF142|nr:hypothetical protein [Mesorhizobium sp.]TIO50362.1 MAG: hypothetical protein E5X78_21645 [Mesorhizobium sp.]TIO56028.1 MAG: hypothetical protein E5X79_32490 [Mesorhizobium sp.]
MLEFDCDADREFFASQHLEMSGLPLNLVGSEVHCNAANGPSRGAHRYRAGSTCVGLASPSNSIFRLPRKWRMKVLSVRISQKIPWAG